MDCWDYDFEARHSNTHFTHTRVPNYSLSLFPFLIIIILKTPPLFSHFADKYDRT